jgi:hypothetical protein
MKKHFLVAGALLVTTSVAFAHVNHRQIKPKEAALVLKKVGMNAVMNTLAKDDDGVSNQTKLQFGSDFSDATNVHFEATKAFDEVTFTEGKKELTAYYDGKSELVGTVEKKDFTDLPEHIQKDILKKYNGYTISGVVEYNDNKTNDELIDPWGISNIDGDNYFVELKNDNNVIVLKASLSGDVDYFTTLQ